MEWIRNNIFLFEAIGQIAQALAAIFAAVAAWYAKKATEAARAQTALTQEEANRNQQSFQFSWQPLLQVKLDLEEEISRNQDLVIPSSMRDRRYNSMPQRSQNITYHFNNWRTFFAEESEMEFPGYKCSYLIMRVENIQKNPIGQAVDIIISLSLEYADPSKPPTSNKMDDYEKIKEEIHLKLENISPEQEIEVWLAHIELVPKLKANVTGINCKTWNGVQVIRGIGSSIDLSGKYPIFTMNLVDVPINCKDGELISLRDGIKVNMSSVPKEVKQDVQSAISNV